MLADHETAGRCFRETGRLADAVVRLRETARAECGVTCPGTHDPIFTGKAGELDAGAFIFKPDRLGGPVRGPDAPCGVKSV